MLHIHRFIFIYVATIHRYIFNTEVVVTVELYCICGNTSLIYS